MKTVIHRDFTFEYDGKTYRVLAGGPGWGYEITSLESGITLADDFETLRDVRAYVDMMREGGWPLGSDRS